MSFKVFLGNLLFKFYLKHYRPSKTRWDIGGTEKQPCHVLHFFLVKI